MADPVYIAKTAVRIGRQFFKVGQKVTGVSPARCAALAGRFIETEDDAKKRTAAAKSGKDAK